MRADGAEPGDAWRWRGGLGDRHRGVGFDQLAVIRDGGEAIAVDFWNADGSCGRRLRQRDPLRRAAPDGRVGRGRRSI
jgi:hypothetical protein